MNTLRALLEAQQFIACPGVFDLVSAKLADRAGANVIYMTGFGTVASYLGQPDAGIATYTEMCDRVEAIAQAIGKPLIADGDTGYGGLLNVYHTVRGYEKAGAAAIQLEDQEIPKKCGHTPNRQVVPLEDMVTKIKVASDARSSSDFLIVARTDARTSYGFDEALRRAEAYQAAGADIIFVEALESEDEMRRVCAAIDAPLLSNQVHGGRTPILSQAELHAMGFALAIYPVAGLMAAAQALAGVYASLVAGKAVETPMYAFSDFVEMIGFPAVWEFEKKYVLQVAAKEYGPP